MSDSTSDSSSSTALVLAAPSEPPLTGIQAIPLKKTMLLVNHFIVNTTEFLNKTCSTAEEKLSRISRQTQKLEILMALLEAKLESIQWLGGAAKPPQNSSSEQPAADGGVPAPPPMSSDSTLGAPPPAPEPSPAAAPGNFIPLKEDSRYAKFFKLLTMKVPKDQLKMNMKAAGLDPSILDLDPDGPAPDGAVSVNQQQDDEDSEEDQEMDDA